MDGRLTGDAPLSFSGRRWILRPVDAGRSASLAQALGVPDLLARLLVSRGIGADGAARHLAPRLRDWLPDPSIFAGMDALAARLADAVRRGETIALFGDYDVDGAAAVALTRRFLAAVGATVVHAVPHRLRDGYGPNGDAFRALLAKGASVIVCLDCGSSAHDPIASVAAHADVLVIDHHRAESAPAAAAAHVNPNLAGATDGHGHLCAAAIAFLAAVAVNRELRRSGWPRSLDSADLIGLVDLVGLATVADVMPLVGLNRAFVAQGLASLERSPRVGLASLLRVAGVSGALDAETIGFALAPRLNAAGRIDDADLGVRLLLTDDEAEAEVLARRLESLNRERQRIEADVLAAALRAAEAQAAEGRSVLVVHGEGWHPGVVGIVAGRVRERFGRPALVLAVSDGVAVGSGRSVPGFDLGAAVSALVRDGVAIRGGGHRMAAGLTVRAEAVGAVSASLCALAERSVTVGPEPIELEGTAAIEGATAEAAVAIARLGPFGHGNAEPLFAVAGRIASVAPVGVGGEHLRVTLEGETGVRLQAIAFRAAGQPVGEGILASRGGPVRLAGALRVDRFRGGEAASLRIVDAAPA